jgi:hypothetical protein
MDAGTAAAVDMVRTADLVKGEERAVRKALEKARAIARSATRTVKAFVVKNGLAVAAGGCSLAMSVIRRRNRQPRRRGALYTLAVSGVSSRIMERLRQSKSLGACIYNGV